jgi:hypothetical protein
VIRVLRGCGDDAARGAEIAGWLKRRLDLVGDDTRRGQPTLQLGDGQQHVAGPQPRAHRPFGAPDPAQESPSFRRAAPGRSGLRARPGLADLTR